MTYLQRKKLAFISIVNSVKGFIRTIIGVFPLTLTNCVDGDSITDYTVYGNSVQDGTPTPDTPIEVESVGEYDEATGKYKIPITVSGKNILKFSYRNKTGKSNGVTFKGNSDGSVTLNGTCTERFQVGFLPQTQFSKATSCRLYAYPTASDQYRIYTRNGYVATENGVSISIVDDINNIYLDIYKDATFENFTIYPMMIVGGKSGEEWEPYHEPITTNIYLDKPLRKVGDYADYIKSVDLVNGTGKVVRNVGKYTFTGTEEFQRRSSYSNKTTKYSLSNTLERYAGTSCMSNIGSFENGTNANSTGKTGVGLWNENKTTSRIVYIEVPYEYNAVESLSTYLSNNEVYVIYPLATPTETPITLPTIPTFKGTSILTADTTIQPSNAEVTYYSTAKE